MEHADGESGPHSVAAVDRFNRLVRRSVPASRARRWNLLASRVYPFDQHAASPVYTALTRFGEKERKSKATDADSQTSNKPCVCRP